ncbi:MAG: CPBP family glutamic-type intramembrane protease [Candidatus Methylomirabilales bacterium]
MGWRRRRSTPRIPVTLLSLVLCLLREVHGSVAAPIAAHAIYNLTLLLGLAG